MLKYQVTYSIMVPNFVVSTPFLTKHYDQNHYKLTTLTELTLKKAAELNMVLYMNFHNNHITCQLLKKSLLFVPL